MIGFFDTSVHVALLRGHLSIDAILSRAQVRPVRLHPVVASELLRGARGTAVQTVERLVRQMVAVEPPSWRAAFLEAGRTLPRLFQDHEQVGLARLQNDVLLAITARHTGALFVTMDRHFDALRAGMPFACLVLES